VTAWAAVWAEYERANRRANDAYWRKFCDCGGAIAYDGHQLRCTEPKCGRVAAW
jgi:hypothetical protein